MKGFNAPYANSVTRFDRECMRNMGQGIHVTDDNPFRPPSPDDADLELPLADDAEFLISDSAILCRATVELPKACIHTGDTEDLVVRRKTLERISGTGYLAMVCAAALFLGLPSLARVAWAYAGTILTAFFIGRALLRNRWPWINSVNATWYVSERYLRSIRWKKIVGTVICIGLSAWGGLLIADSLGSDGDMLAGAAVGGICGWLLSLGLKVEGELVLAGRRLTGPNKGCMILRGHNRKFAEVVRRVIAGSF